MKKTLYTFIILLITSCGNAPTKTTTGNSPATTQSLPTHTQCGNDASTAGIRHALSLQVLEDMTDEEAAAWKPCDSFCQGLTWQQFDTIYNDNCILGIRRSAEYMGAYPSGNVTYFTFDLNSGSPIHATDIFLSEKQPALIAICKNRLARIAEENKTGLNDEEQDSYDMFVSEAHPFAAEDLERYYLEDDSLTFYYDFGFAHAWQGLAPPGDIKFSKQEIAPYINPAGRFAFLLQ